MPIKPIPPKPVDTSRRRLLSGALGTGAAAGLGLGTVAAHATSAAPEPSSAKDTDTSRYHETEHIRRYYDSADR